MVEKFYEAGPNCIVLVPMFGGFVGEGAVTLSEGEHDDYRWISADAADSYLPFEHQRSTVALIERKFVRKKPNELLRIVP